jgi:hypothetical protein
MLSYSLAHVGDRDLLQGLGALVAQDRATTAELLAHIAEVDARQLYLPAAYPSMYLYCVHELRLSEDSALKRIQAARAAREFPVVFEAVASGRLHLSGVVLLAPHLSAANVDGLVAAATHLPKAGIARLLAERFPLSETLPLMETIPVTPPDTRPAPGQVMVHMLEPVAPDTQHAPGHVEAPTPRSTVAPVASGRYLLRLTIGQDMHDRLRHAQDLLGHRLPAADVAQVLDRGLRLLVAALEKTKYAATDRPTTKPRPTRSRRHVPAAVKRAVWERDGGRCTFTSATGQRCPACSRLELDHVEPVARGGRATEENLRLSQAGRTTSTRPGGRSDPGS